MAWPGERYIPEEQRKKIKSAKRKESQLNCYTYEAVQRMTPKPTTLKLKDYKGVK